MSHFFRPFIAIGLLTLACHAPTALAQSSASVSAVEQQHARAVGSFREGRFPEAFGRFAALADAGHAPSASTALWMFLNGPNVFGRDWDSHQDQLTAWAQLARQPVPVMVGRVYAQTPGANTAVASAKPLH